MPDFLCAKMIHLQTTVISQKNLISGIGKATLTDVQVSVESYLKLILVLQKQVISDLHLKNFLAFSLPLWLGSKLTFVELSQPKFPHTNLPT